jgi:hypothetical protein
MKKHPKTMLVVVAEAVLEGPLLRDAKQLGAQGWTVADVRSASLEGVREGAWEADRSIEIRLICDAQVADAIARHVLEQYAPYYSIAMVFTPAEVLRPERF